jgi:hypothetical protein
MLTPHIAGDRDTLIYPKQDHTPATFTILNFPVNDIDSAVDQLSARGIRFQTLDGVDESGIFRGRGPAIARVDRCRPVSLAGYPDLYG